MQARTKRHPIDKTVVLTFHGPESNREKAIEALSHLGYVDTTGTIPWREAFPEITDEALPGVCLRAARQREGLSQVALAKQTGIPQRHISEMENGKRPIGKKNARIFADALNAGYKVFL
jgi:DNA-binding transcriptional regulator YiaG